MKMNEFGNVINSLRKLFPDDKRERDVFDQEYYPALKGYDLAVVVKAVNALAARITNFQKMIWPLDTILEEAAKHAAGKHYPVVRWRKNLSDVWKHDTIELEKARSLEKKNPDQVQIEYGTLPEAMQSHYDDPNDPVASPETVKDHMSKIVKIIEQASGPLAKVIKKEITSPTKREEPRYVKHEVDI